MRSVAAINHALNDRARRVRHASITPADHGEEKAKQATQYVMSIRL